MSQFRFISGFLFTNKLEEYSKRVFIGILIDFFCHCKSNVGFLLTIFMNSVKVRTRNVNNICMF